MFHFPNALWIRRVVTEKWAKNGTKNMKFSSNSCPRMMNIIFFVWVQTILEKFRKKQSHFESNLQLKQKKSTNFENVGFLGRNCQNF